MSDDEFKLGDLVIVRVGPDFVGHHARITERPDARGWWGVVFLHVYEGQTLHFAPGYLKRDVITRLGDLA